MKIYSYKINTTTTIYPPSSNYAVGTLKYFWSMDFKGIPGSTNLWTGTQTMTYEDDSIGITYEDNTKQREVGGWDDIYKGSSKVEVSDGNLSDRTGHFLYGGSISYTNKLSSSLSTNHDVHGDYLISLDGCIYKLLGKSGTV